MGACRMATYICSRSSDSRHRTDTETDGRAEYSGTTYGEGRLLVMAGSSRKNTIPLNSIRFTEL